MTGYEEGWTLTVGGNVGAQLRIGNELTKGLNNDLAAVEKFGRKKVSRVQRSVRLDSSLAGKVVRLREGRHKQVREREWVFNRTDQDSIFLIHKSGAYGLVVGLEDIDWDEV